jgi:uncharacterized repeat protein (TIGR03803 family)
MKRALRLLAAILAVCILAVLTQAQIQPHSAPSYEEKVLHAFNGTSDGWVTTSLIRDVKGNLYGANMWGGYLGDGCNIFFTGCGTVFELTAAGKFKVLHTFSYLDGAVPFGNLIRDASGNLYGTTIDGGRSGDCDSGCGVVFKLTPRGQFTTLHNFTNGSDGAYPLAGVVMDAAGNLYGAAQNGASGGGVVFELTPSGDFHVLHSFDKNDGFAPNGLLLGADGNLYGTTNSGGDLSCSTGGSGGCGVVYKLDKAGTETVLYRFKGTSDGLFPVSPLFMDKAGNLFGTAEAGGNKKGHCNLSDAPSGCGTVFKIDSAGKFSLLFTFDSADGAEPFTGPLIQDSQGDLFGTTSAGGNGKCTYTDGATGCGVVFKITSAGKESVLYNFKRQSDGGVPYTGVVEDSKGNLYGTTVYGGHLSCTPGSGEGCGVIFELKP